MSQGGAIGTSGGGGGARDLHTAKLIVNTLGTVGTGANYTTIASALAAATTGNTIFVMPGVYTENLTLKAGVNISAFTCDATTPNVTIAGTLTMTVAGTASISGIRLQTNGANFLAVTGSAASNVFLQGCYLNCTNSDGITFSSSSSGASISILECIGNLATTGIRYFAHSSAGIINILNCNLFNTGSSTTVNTQSAGILNISYTGLSSPVTTSGTAALTWDYMSMDVSGFNVTAATLGGSGVHNIRYSRFMSGTASAVIVNNATSLLESCTVNSSNTNAVSGIGIITYSGMIFEGTSIINTTTQVYNYTNLGKYKASGQPSFSAYLAAVDSNVTGDGTSYTLGTNTAFTEIFDIGGNFNTNGTFTAPVTGTYLFSVHYRVGNISAAMTLASTAIVTTSRTYFSNDINIGAVRSVAVVSNIAGLQNTVIANMNAGDTCTCLINIFGGTKTAYLLGSADTNATTYFQGALIA